MASNNTVSILEVWSLEFIYFIMYNLMMATMMAETCSC